MPQVAATAAVFARQAEAEESRLAGFAPHRALDHSFLAPFRGAGLRNVIVEELSDRLREDDDIVLAHECGPLDA